MLDCVAALEWVRDNIENFGGDPGNVMIFGQSGGGAKVSTLLCMPSAKGLFHRAAIQSGSALRLTSRAAATKSAERMIAQIGLDRSRIAELRDVPFEMMISAQETLGAQTPPAGFAPVVDGAVIPRNPFDPDAPRISADVPVIVSTTLDDAALGRTDFSLDEAGLRQQVRAIAGDRADTIIAARCLPQDNTLPAAMPHAHRPRRPQERCHAGGAQSRTEPRARLRVPVFVAVAGLRRKVRRRARPRRRPRIPQSQGAHLR